MHKISEMFKANTFLSPREAMAKVLDCVLEVSEIKLQSRYNV